jgi:hypothetical protein
MFTMKYSARRCSVGAWTAFGLRGWALAALALVVLDSVRCSRSSPDPLLASGEQALVGSYKLDHVLLAPGKLVMLPNSSQWFADMSDTPEQAAQKGLLNPAQLDVLKRQDCTMTILADHSFVITNLPSTDLTQTFSVKGTWAMEVYHVFETYGYRISLKCAGYKGPALHAKFFGADKPSLPILEIFYGDGKKVPLIFRVAKASWQAGPRRSGAP